MDVKILQSKNLGFVVCEVDTECACEDNYCVTNPRMLQMFIAPSPDGSPPQLQIQLLPMVYKEVLKVENFETYLPKGDYSDVTDQFDDSIVDMYLKVEGRVEAPEAGTIDLFS